MDKLTGTEINGFWVVVLAIFAFIVLLNNVIKAVRDWRQPQDDLEKWRRDVDTKLKNDNERLKSMEESNRVVCRGILALLSHELNGNSTEKLKDSQTEITNYLINR